MKLLPKLHELNSSAAELSITKIYLATTPSLGLETVQSLLHGDARFATMGRVCEPVDGTRRRDLFAMLGGFRLCFKQLWVMCFLTIDGLRWVSDEFGSLDDVCCCCWEEMKERGDDTMSRREPGVT